MKKWLLALVLVALLASLYSCDDEMIDNAVQDATNSTAIDADTAAQTQDAEADNDINKTEFIIYEDRIFFISKTSAEVQNQFADAVNALFRSLPDGLNKYMMIAPMRIAFEVDEVQPLTSDQKAEIKNIYTAMDPSVTLVDAYYALSQHADNLNDIYFRTDRHWTHLGSYYAAQAIFEAADISYHKIDEYVEYNGGEFLGYLYDLANDPAFLDMPDTLLYYLLPDVNRKTLIYVTSVETGELEEHESIMVDTQRYGYDVFLWENGISHAVIYGNEQSDRSLLLIGDSHTNAILTWFADSFKTIVFIDPRYYVGGRDGIAELVGEYGITDALVLVSTSDSAALTSYFGRSIEQLAQ